MSEADRDRTTSPPLAQVLYCEEEHCLATITFLLVLIGVGMFAAGELLTHVLYWETRFLGDLTVAATMYPVVIPLGALALFGESVSLVTGCLLLVDPSLLLAALNVPGIGLLTLALFAAHRWGSTSRGDVGMVPRVLRRLRETPPGFVERMLESHQGLSVVLLQSLVASRGLSSLELTPPLEPKDLPVDL